MTGKDWNKTVMPRKKVLRLASALSAIALSLLTIAPVQAKLRSHIIFDSDFESGNLNNWDIHEGCCDYSHSLVSDPTRTGNFAYRSLLKPQDPERSEVQLDPFPKDAERWVGVSIYFPNEGDKINMSVFQFHIKPDKGQKWTSPPFQLKIENQQLILKRYAKGTTGSKSQKWLLGPVVRGQWTDFVFHIKSSSTANGLFEAWVNGSQKVSYQGVTALNRSRGPFIKMGVYVGIGKHVAKDTPLYYDELRIGDENATYEDVAPSGN